MTLPAEALQIETPSWRTDDVALLEEMTRRFMEEEVVPQDDIEAMIKQTGMVDTYKPLREQD